MVEVLQGDCRTVLAGLPDASAHCCVTSPPYWGLRDYGGEAQLGLEETPEQYVEEMVGVFREVRRVLRDDGTLWLNLGDSYATAGGLGTQGATGQRANRRYTAETGRWKQTPDGLKPKDLIGIPWLVAKGLQQPYYTGTIKDERDRIWLAAMLDAEGCMFIHKRKAGQHNGQGYYRKNDSFGPGVEIANTSEAVIDRIMALVGKGSICRQGPDETRGRRRQTIYRWNLRTVESRDFVREVYPYLVAKRQQARILIGCPSSGERAEQAHEALISLHRTGTSDVDFQEPESMFQRGWYLRSDVIWSKANPMPESVKDRPTKAHEYVFLLSKSERYYYDADAITEPNAGRPSGNGYARPHRLSVGGRGQTEQYQPDKPRNARSVWTISTQPFPEAHFAVFPETLARRCILAGCPEGGTVLDPFGGSGTVGLVAKKLGNSAVLVEQNPDYCAMARRRIGSVSETLFGGEAA